MTASLTTPGPEEDGPPITLSRPQCLHHRAPRRIAVSVGVGRCPRVTQLGIRLTAGQTVRVAVTPPSATPGQPPAKVRVVPDPAFLTVIDTTRVGEAEVSYHAEFRAQLHSAIPEFVRNKIPLPCRGELVVAVDDEKFEPLRVVVPFLIWPSLKTLFVSGLLTVGLTYVLPQLMARAGSAPDPATAVWELVSEPLFLLRALGFTAAATVGLHLIGSLLVLTGLVGEEG